MARHKRLRAVLSAAILLATAPASAFAHHLEGCDDVEYPSTFALIEKVIFENHGCTDSLCHGSAVAGGLDLRPGAAYENLIDQPSQTVPRFHRIVPGQKEQSLFWLNLAAKTLPGEWAAPLRAMPLDPLPALRPEELEAVRLWITHGAPKDGVVPGTGELLNTCLPPDTPIEVEPLPPPPPGVGIQLHMPRWSLAARSERETCFASYYDFSDQVPEEFRDPTGTKLRFNHTQIRQDPLSHHMFASIYQGTVPPDDPRWGEFTCRGGTQDGVPCDPTDVGSCGDGGDCATTPVNSLGCIGFGPGDASIGFASFGITGAQQTAVERRLSDGVFVEMPLKGIVVWSSHAFNLTNESGKLEAWLNFDFAPPEEQQSPMQSIVDVSQIFKMDVPPFAAEEVCNHYFFPESARLFELGSHVHKRGHRFRIFEGTFRCEGGPKNGAACTPLGGDLESPDICAGAPCVSALPRRFCDCNGNQVVTVDELVMAVNIALGTRSVGDCPEADSNRDESVSVDELVTGVNAAIDGAPGPEDSVIYESLVYDDPVVRYFDPPMVMSGAGSSPHARSMTYCALYDNGYTDPNTVKTRAGSPTPPFGSIGLGGPCQIPTACVAGKVGAPCSGSNEDERNASCDSFPGSGNGFCDACELRGGVTTEDEMFVFLGSYYLP